MISTFLYFTGFLFLCVTYFYLTTIAVTFGTTAAIKAFLIEHADSNNSVETITQTPTEENTEEEIDDFLRKMRGEDQ